MKNFIISLCLLFLLPSLAHALDVREVVTPKGLKAFFVEDHTLPIITLSFAFKGGSAQEAAEKAGVTRLMVSLLDEGAGNFEAEQFQDKLDEVAARIGFSAGRDQIFGSFKTLKAHENKSFDLLKLALDKPRFDEKPFLRIKTQILSSLKSEENNPDSRAGKALRAALYPENHPYRRTVSGMAETVKKLQREDLFAIKERLMAKDNLLISVVGAIREEDLLKKLDHLFGDLPEKANLRKIDNIAPKTGALVKVEDERPQVRFNWVGKGIARKDPDFIAAYLVNQILGGSGLSSRLSLEVREKRGLAYNISTGLSNRPHVNIFSGSVQTRVDLSQETLKIVQQELAKMAKNGPTEEELELAKDYTIGVYALNFNSSGSIARTLTGLQLQGLSANYLKTRAEQIRAVTLEDAKRVAHRLLGGDFTYLQLGPVL